MTDDKKVDDVEKAQPNSQPATATAAAATAGAGAGTGAPAAASAASPKNGKAAGKTFDLF